MKKISAFLFGLMALLAMPSSATAADVVFDFTTDALRGYVGTGLTDTQSYIYNETWTLDGVSMQVTCGAAPSRLTTVNNRGVCLVMYKDYTTMTIKAPNHMLITKVTFEQAGTGALGLVAANGTLNGNEWTGLADGVRFTATGTPYLAKATVTLADKTVMPGIDYTEVNSIAAFNALADGIYAKLTLTDAEVIGKSADGYSTVWVQDATGGAWIQYTTLNDRLAERTKVSGTIYTVKRTASANPQMKEAEDTPSSELTAADIADYTTLEGTLAELNVAANLNRVVRITGASFVATSATAGKLTQGNSEITVNNGTATANQQLHKISDTWVKDQTKMDDVTIVAILVAKSATENQLLPISMTGTIEAATIAEFNAAADGMTVRLTLTDARVNGVNMFGDCYVEDATAATVIKKAALNAGTALNGIIVGTKSSEDVDYVHDPSLCIEHSMSATDATGVTATATELVGTPMTIAEACTQANHGRLVKLSNVDIATLGNGMNKQLTDAEGNTMKARDLLSVLSNGYEWPVKALSVTGVVIYYMTGWFLLPVAEQAIVPAIADGITTTKPSAATPNSTTYNLKGTLTDKQQKGINIVNGKKVLVR